MTVAAPPTPAVRLAVITGLSGAGRSTSAKCLEDLGWFVVDNLPPALLDTMADLAERSQGGVSKVAAVLDVRSLALSSDLRDSVRSVARRGHAPRILFLEASDEALVRRFESVRRPHPLQGDGRLVDGIARERELLADLRGEADIVVDTTALNVHELRAEVSAAFGDADEAVTHLTLVSFGYKYGLPVDADLVADCRFLPNPHWVPKLRPHSGLEAPVRDYVLAQRGAEEFLDRYADLLRVVLDGYRREGKRFVTLAVGCTGGKHRSVVVSEQLLERLAGPDVAGRVVHRDLGRE